MQDLRRFQGWTWTPRRTRRSLLCQEVGDLHDTYHSRTKKEEMRSTRVRYSVSDCAVWSHLAQKAHLFPFPREMCKTKYCNEKNGNGNHWGVFNIFFRHVDADVYHSTAHETVMKVLTAEFWRMWFYENDVSLLKHQNISEMSLEEKLEWNAATGSVDGIKTKHLLWYWRIPTKSDRTQITSEGLKWSGWRTGCNTSSWAASYLTVMDKLTASDSHSQRLTFHPVFFSICKPCTAPKPTYQLQL